MTCIFEDTFLFSSRFLSLSLHFLTSLEIPIHLFGVWLIYTKTPKTMNSAKSSIMQLHIACSIMDFYLSFLLVFYIWVPSPSGYPVGLLTNLGLSSTIQMYLFCNIMIIVALSLVAFFENRYDAVVIGQIGRSSTRNFKRVVYFGMNTLFCSLDIGYIFWKMPDPEVARLSIQTWKPCIPTSLTTHPMYISLNVGDPIIPLISGAMVLGISLQGAYFVFYTSYYLFFSIRNVSKSTQKLQKKFFLAMALQALIPTIAFLAPLCYYYWAWKFDYYNQKYNNIAMIVIGFNGLLTTIVMILVHAPYRNTVTDMLGIVRRSADVITSSRVFTMKAQPVNSS